MWNLPAGRVEIGSSIEVTAVKEAKEETGYDIALVKEIGIYQEKTDEGEPQKHAFEAEITGGSLDYPKDEILNAQWFTYEEIQNMRDKLRNEWILKTITTLEKH